MERPNREFTGTRGLLEGRSSIRQFPEDIIMEVTGIKQSKDSGRVRHLFIVLELMVPRIRSWCWRTVSRRWRRPTSRHMASIVCLLGARVGGGQGENQQEELRNRGARLLRSLYSPPRPPVPLFDCGTSRRRIFPAFSRVFWRLQRRSPSVGSPKTRPRPLCKRHSESGLAQNPC